MELPFVSVGESMPSAQRPPNRLLQALPEADYAALHRHLEVAVLVRNAVLVEAGAALTHVYLPHAGAVSMVVNLSDGQTVEVAMIDRDGVVGASTALVDGISLSDVVVSGNRLHARYCALQGGCRAQCRVTEPAGPP
jgi:hypothetical protein